MKQKGIKTTIILAISLLSILAVSVWVIVSQYRLTPPNTPTHPFSPLPTGVLVVATATPPVRAQAAIPTPDLRPSEELILYWRTGYENIDRLPGSGEGMYFLISPTLTIDIQLRQAGHVTHAQTITWTGIPANGIAIPYTLDFTKTGVYSAYIRARWDYDGYTKDISEFYTTYTNITGTVFLKNISHPSDGDNFFYNGDIKVGELSYVYLPLIYKNPPPPTPTPGILPIK